MGERGSKEMKNIDRELIDWAMEQIKTKYPEDVALLIGQVGACKLPTDEQQMAFDFFIPATERGNQLAQTFIIEDMGYDLYPISWERLEGIADIKEPRMLFAFVKGEILYAKSEAEQERFYALKRRLQDNLKNKTITFEKALEFLNTAMEIFQTMLFEESLCTVRKAAGGISCYLMNALAMLNGTYLRNGYEYLGLEMKRLESIPEEFSTVYQQMLHAQTIEALQQHCYELIKITRDFFMDKQPPIQEETVEPHYVDLGYWYQEARYSFRKIEHYAAINEAEECFLIGCYLQIEFDAIQTEFGLQAMDLLGAFDEKRLYQFAERAKQLEDYIISILERHQVSLNRYKNLEEFLEK